MNRQFISPLLTPLRRTHFLFSSSPLLSVPLPPHRLTYHYNNAILTDTTGQVIYKEALKYALVTANFFLRNGNFSLALDYLEYAETIARTDEEFIQIKTVLKTAESIVNQSFSDDTTPAPLASPSADETTTSPHTTPPAGGGAAMAIAVGGNSTAAQREVNLSIANMFYEQNTLGSNPEDFIYDDYLHLYERLQERILVQEQEPALVHKPINAPHLPTHSSPPVTLKPVAMAPSTPQPSSSASSTCTIS
jgi:hypothetical protein